MCFEGIFATVPERCQRQMGLSGLLVFLVLCIPVLFPARIPAQSIKKTVLVLHSYHPGLPWTDHLMAGVRAGFGEDLDYRRPNRFDVALRDFPAGSQGINRPPSFSALSTKGLAAASGSRRRPVVVRRSGWN